MTGAARKMHRSFGAQKDAHLRMTKLQFDGILEDLNS